jgi:Concanavalin A-like lectin/glucanases superfamily
MPPSYPAGSYPARVVADGAVAYWRLGEASGTSAVDVIGGKNGTISGGVTLAQVGALADGDKAVRFDGVDGKILTVAAVPIPLICTIEGWINYQSAPQSTKKFFVTRGLTGASGDTVAIGTNGTGGAGTLAADIGAAGDVVGLLSAPANQWHHCVYVMNGSTIAFYLNGVFDRTQPFVRTTPSGGPCQIGFDPGVFAYLGTVDDIAIYPTALTAPQIAAHYAAKDWVPVTLPDMRYRWCRYVPRRVGRR